MRSHALTVRRPLSDGIGRLHPRRARVGTLDVAYHTIDIRFADSNFVLFSAVRTLDLELQCTVLAQDPGSALQGAWA